MATMERVEKLSLRERQNRYFSENFKKKKVLEIEQNLSTISEISREYQVSKTAIRKWLYKYSTMHKKGVKQVVELKSDTNKIRALKDQIKDLEQALGQKQMQLDFQSKVLDLIEEEYDIDVKKKYGERLYCGFGVTEGNTPTR